MILLAGIVCSSLWAAPIDAAVEAIPVPSGIDLQSQSVQWLGGTHVRLTPTIDGLEVIGADVRVNLDPREGVRQVHGKPPQTVPPTLDPTVTPEQASQIAEAALHTESHGRLGSPRAHLVVYAENPDEPRLAWATRVGHARTSRIWVTYVDAHTGEILATEADSWSATGAVFPVSPAKGDLETVTLPGLRPGPLLMGEYGHAASCVEWDIDPRPYGERDCLAWKRTAKASIDGSFTYEPQYGEFHDPFAEVMTYYHTDRIARWAADTYGVRLNHSIRILSNFPLTNAFFGDFDSDGRRDLSFGISDDGLNLGYDADVIYHEFGHAIVRDVAGSMWMQADSLGIDWTPGALNEGFADAISMVFNPDHLLAEYMGESDRWEEAIRDHEPDRFCPDDLQSQVHRSGQIWGSMSWNLIDDPRVGPELMAELLMGALPTWSNSTNWDDAGQSLLESADILLDEDFIGPETHDAVYEHVTATGMLDCERIIDLRKVPGSTQKMINLGLAGDYSRIPLGVQFKVHTPAESTALAIHLQDFTGVGENTGWTLYLRAGEPVEHTTGRVEGVGLLHAIPIEFDFTMDGQDDYTLVMDAASDPPLDPGEIYYLALAAHNTGRDILDVAYASITVSADTEMGLVAPTEPTVEGCGCSAPPKNTPGIWLYLVSAFLLIRRTRTTIIDSSQTMKMQ